MIKLIVAIYILLGLLSWLYTIGCLREKYWINGEDIFKSFILSCVFWPFGLPIFLYCFYECEWGYAVLRMINKEDCR